MTESKNPNPIEEAIGDRAKDLNGAEKFKQEYLAEPVGQIPTEPSPSEMLSLEELNRQTEERYLNDTAHLVSQQSSPTIPVSKPDPLPVIKNSTQESPPQETENNTLLQPSPLKQVEEFTTSNTVVNVTLDSPDKHVEVYNNSAEKMGIPKIEGEPPTISAVTEMINKHPEIFSPAEDKDLTALKEYILGNGFVVAMVAMHIRMLCTSAMTTPSTTDWDFEDRAHIPELVLALLHQPGYIEGIWPSLCVIMNTNKANPAWTAGISMTIAFFDVIKTLPMLKELKNESKP